MYNIKINIAADNAVGDPLYMEDWGLKIEFEGLTLPTAYEVHFSNNPASPAKMAIGDASGVVVPYEYTAKSGTLYGWLVFANPSSGYTKRAFTVAITRRSPLDPPQVLPEQVTVIDTAIAALNVAIVATSANVAEAAASAENAAESATNAANSATASATSATAASDSATAAASSAADASASQATANAAATRADFAMNAARTSAESADESATLAQTAVEESADNAQAAAESASQAAASKAQAATDATRANTYATRAQASANTASDKATSASNSAGAALNHANNAATSATAAGQAQTAAETAAGTATEKAAEAGQSATDAAESATEAQAAATEAGQIVDDATAFALGAYATSSASGAVATVDDGAENVPVKALTAYIVPVQEGSGDPSPDNVRQIHGYTGMSIARTRKNLLPPINGGTQSGVTCTVAADGTVTLNGTATETIAFKGEFGSYVWDGVTQCWLSGCPSGGNYLSGYSLRVDSENGGFSSPDTGGGRLLAPYANSRPIVGQKLQFAVVVWEGTACDNLIFKPVLELGATATAYEPYQGEVYPVTWQDEAGTVYGGYYEAVTGVLTVTKWGVDLDTLTYSTRATGNINKMLSTSLPYNYIASHANGYLRPWLLENYAQGRPTSAASLIRTVDTASIGVYSFSAGNGVETVTVYLVLPKDSNPTGKLVYELATPITYQLTPLDIRTLRGVNNIFTDTGDTDATVRADPDLHINKLIAEAVALALENA